jgi:hypothetical protein
MFSVGLVLWVFSVYPLLSQISDNGFIQILEIKFDRNKITIGL